MDRSRDYAATQLDVALGEKRRPEQPAEDAPFRVAFLADFSGRANRRATPAAKLRDRKPIAVDLDNFDAVLHRLGARLQLPGPDAPVLVEFNSLDDFHPDALYQKLPLFDELRRMQHLAMDERPAPRRPAPDVADPLASALSSGSLLDDLVSSAEAPLEPGRKPDAWQQTIRNIVAPHLQARPDKRQAEMAGRVNETIHLAMRMLLHHPDFQDLESAWRSVDFVLRRLGTAEDLQVYLIDVSKQELLDDLTAVPDLRSTGIYRLLVEHAAATPDENAWAVVAGLYTFEPEPGEIRALGAMARIAQEAQAPFLSSVSPRLLGCESFGRQPDPDDWTAKLAHETEQEWNKLRGLPEARWIGIALPRFLLRDPYGKDSTDLEGFEEMTAPPDYDDYLWANPAVACAYLVAESFLRDGWDVPLRATEINGLPVHNYKANGETVMTPCAECWMGEQLAERFLMRGVMPLASIKGRDAVRLIRLQSVGAPVSGLRARWNPA